MLALDIISAVAHYSGLFVMIVLVVYLTARITEEFHNE